MVKTVVNGVLCQQTTVHVPEHLHGLAKKHRLCMSGILRDALESELEARGIDVRNRAPEEGKQAPTSTPTPGPLTNSVDGGTRDVGRLGSYS